MKLFIKTSVLSLVIFLLLSFSATSTAHACSSVSIQPSTAVQGSPFVVLATGCDSAGFGLGGYGVHVYGPDEYLGFYGTLINSGNGDGGLMLGVFSDVGTYTVEIYQQDDLQTSTTFRVTESVDTPPPVDEPFNCGDIVTFGAPTCNETLTANCCPQACPSQANPVGSGYVCLVRSNVPTCAFGNGADEYGIPSAVGCIPYSDANQFTIFASRWLAGIAGGIALLLICVSALLYMTSQGNPDRLGEAKNIALAAITGLILILLAIILFRIAVEILGLF